MRLRRGLAITAASVVLSTATVVPAAYAGEVSPAYALSRVRDLVTAPGTAWGLDPAREKVLVYADSTVGAPELRRIGDGIAALGSRAGFVKVPGSLHSEFGSGDVVYDSGTKRCSVAFIAQKDGEDYFLTAGHCVAGDAFYEDADRQRIAGSVVGHEFSPVGDFALVRLTAGLTVSGPTFSIAREAVIGEQVTLSGSTSGTVGGTVTAVDVTANYPEGPVSGLVESSLCSKPGDSGGAVYSGNAAVAIHSGGNAVCGEGAVSFHQPVVPAMAAFGVTLR